MREMHGRNTVKVTGKARKKLAAAGLAGLGMATTLALIGPVSAPAQGGFLICAKTKKPDKGALRMPAKGFCKSGERGLFVNQTGPQGPPGTPGGPAGPPGIQGPAGPTGVRVRRALRDRRARADRRYGPQAGGSAGADQGPSPRAGTGAAWVARAPQAQQVRRVRSRTEITTADGPVTVCVPAP